MFCGYVLSAEETLLQMEKHAAKSPPAIGSDKKRTKPIVEIKAPRSRRTRTDQVKQSPGPQEDRKSQ